MHSKLVFSKICICLKNFGPSTLVIFSFYPFGLSHCILIEGLILSSIIFLFSFTLVDAVPTRVSEYNILFYLSWLMQLQPGYMNIILFSLTLVAAIPTRVSESTILSESLLGLSHCILIDGLLISLWIVS